MRTDTTIRKLLTYAESQLSELETARLDAEILLAEVMHTERSNLYAHPETGVEANYAADFRSLIAKRLDGFPVSYLTGKKEFWSMELIVNQFTLIPRPETECLVESALELIPDGTETTVLDLGTGSGAIAIAISSERPCCKITAVDICDKALSVAGENIKRLEFSNIKLQQSDWFAEIGRESYDIIVCNPPYIDSYDKGFIYGEIRFEPRLALDGSHLGLHAIKKIIPSAITHLNNSGYLIMEHGYNQGADVRKLLNHYQYKEIETRCDYSGIERITKAKLL